MAARYDHWKEALEIAKDRPLLGIGLKTYGLPQVGERYHLRNRTHAHNMFFNVLAELGIFGVIALISWLIIYFLSLIKMYTGIKLNFNQGLWLGGLGCFVVLLIGGIAHPMLGSESSLMLMTVLGLMFAGIRIENEKSGLITGHLHKIPGAARIEHQSGAGLRE